MVIAALRGLSFRRAGFVEVVVFVRDGFVSLEIEGKEVDDGTEEEVEVDDANGLLIEKGLAVLLSLNGIEGEVLGLGRGL